MWTRASLLGALGIALLSSACDKQPTNTPCGVIINSLLGVNATTRAGMQQLADHFQRGYKAGCWDIKGKYLDTPVS